MTTHHLIINEPTELIRDLYYTHATDERNSSYPFITGDTFRAMADYVFDETKQDQLTQVKYGDIVFLKGDMLHMFFGAPYASIPNSFVLVTHNSDFYVPGEQRERLNDKKILAWYGSNPDVHDQPKLIPIPIGLNNQRWHTGHLDRIEHALHHYRQAWNQRSILLYANFFVDNNSLERVLALRHARRLNGAVIVRKKISFDTYLRDIGKAKFVLSPPGSGLDCHRTWEALLMGAVPIVLSSGLDPLFKNIPTLILNRWSELTDTLLSSYQYEAKEDTVPLALYARYWRNRLIQHRLNSTQ